MGQTAGKSKELLDWIQRLAIESPFRQEDVAGAFRLSLAFGFSTKEAQRLTTAMVDFTTATGASGETIERVSRALGQIKTRGKLSMEELNQLAEGGVDALRILGDATGKTGKDLMDSITKGQIDANFAIQAILKDMEKMYAGAGKSAAGRNDSHGGCSSMDARSDIGKPPRWSHIRHCEQSTELDGHAADTGEGRNADRQRRRCVR